tara:strand:- start:722 stop:1051 length:330 start_codon:yes stop_codon:yes gene_type:complete
MSDRYRLDAPLPLRGDSDEDAAGVLEDEARRSRYARDFLASATYARVMDTLRVNALEAFAAIPAHDVDRLVECRRQLQAVEAFHTVLQNMADTGKLALAALQPESAQEL